MAKDLDFFPQNLFAMAQDLDFFPQKFIHYGSGLGFFFTLARDLDFFQFCFHYGSGLRIFVQTTIPHVWLRTSFFFSSSNSVH